MGLCSSNISTDPISKLIDMNLFKDQEYDRKIKKLLLLGPGESGKSTLFKQFTHLYSVGFDHYQRFLSYLLAHFYRLEYKDAIHSNILNCIVILLTKQNYYREKFIIEDLLPESVEAALYLSTYDKTTLINEQCAEHITTLWNDPAIQKTYKLRNKFQLLDSAEYLLNKSQIVAAEDYVPTYEDILRCRIRTTGIVELGFTFNNVTFRVFDVGGQRNERKKWIHCFENVTAVIFVVAISEYDQVLWEDERINRMNESLQLFDNIVNLHWFKNTSIVLFLNKSDIFKAKLETGSFVKYFPDFNGGTDFGLAVKYISVLFNNLNKNPAIQTVYCHVTCGIDTNNVKKVFESCQDIIIRKNLVNTGLLFQ